MNVDNAHIDELKKQLTAAKEENERLIYKLGQQKTAMVDHARKSREHEKAEHAAIVAAARVIVEHYKTCSVVPAMVTDLSAAIEAKFPTPGVYPKRELKPIGDEFPPSVAQQITRVASDIISKVQQGQDKQSAITFQVARVSLSPMAWKRVVQEVENFFNQ